MEFLVQFETLFSFSFQVGFCKSHLTANAVAELTEQIRDQNNKLACFLLDLKKAFDTVGHQVLLLKTLCQGI